MTTTRKAHADDVYIYIYTFYIIRINYEMHCSSSHTTHVRHTMHQNEANMSVNKSTALYENVLPNTAAHTTSTGR